MSKFFAAGGEMMEWKTAFTAHVLIHFARVFAFRREKAVVESSLYAFECRFIMIFMTPISSLLDRKEEKSVTDMLTCTYYFIFSDVSLSVAITCKLKNCLNAVEIEPMTFGLLVRHTVLVQTKFYLPEMSENVKAI